MVRNLFLLLKKKPSQSRKILPEKMKFKFLPEAKGKAVRMTNGVSKYAGTSEHRIVNL